MPLLDSIFRGAVFLHIVRDGRDVACSYRELARRQLKGDFVPRLPNAIREIAAEWHANVVGVLDALHDLAPKRVLTIRFEDLVRDAEPSLRRVCGFLGEEFDPIMLEYHRVNREEGLEPSVLLPWKEKTLRPPVRDAVGRFRGELTDAEAAEFERIAGAALSRCGYSLQHELPASQ